MTLADIPVLRASAEALRAQRHSELLSLLNRVPGGIETFASYEAALRELEVVAKLELELIANGIASQHLEQRARAGFEQGASLDASSPAKSEIASPAAREEPAKANFSTIDETTSTPAAGDGF